MRLVSAVCFVFLVHGACALHAGLGGRGLERGGTSSRGKGGPVRVVHGSSSWQLLFGSTLPVLASKVKRSSSRRTPKKAMRAWSPGTNEREPSELRFAIFYVCPRCAHR